MLNDDELKQTIHAIFLEEEYSSVNSIKMKPWDSDKNLLPELNFDSDSTFKEFLKVRMKEELGLVENPTPEQFEQILKNKPKGKTVYFKDFIHQLMEDSADITDVEIVEEAIKVKVKNKEL